MSLTTLHDRQRRALEEFKVAALKRALNERDIESRLRCWSARPQARFQEERRRIEEEFRQARTAFEEQIAETQGRMEGHYDQEHNRLHSEMTEKKQAAIRTRIGTKSERKPSSRTGGTRTILTMLEADRKVARGHFVEIRRNSKNAVKRLGENMVAARDLMRRWDLLRGAPASRAQAASASEDPHNGLEARVTFSNDCLTRLKSFGLPRLVKGAVPWLMLAIVWVIAAFPAVLVDWWYWWLLGSLLIVPIGWGFIVWLRGEARRAVWAACTP
ncbi:MAG: hypothetical protein U0793_33985 [Gemmataceae bacterium]